MFRIECIMNVLECLLRFFFIFAIAKVNLENVTLVENGRVIT